MDEWDQLGTGTWHRPLPAMDVETYASGEVDQLYITRSGGAFWLSEPNVAGQSEYPTVEAAKKAGDEIVAEMESRQFREIAVAAGLDPESWKFAFEGEFGVFSPASGTGPEIVRDGRGRWTAVEDDEEILHGTSAADVARQVAERAAFTPSI